jgi:hypothetical protein
MNQSGAHTSKVNMARITAAETALRVSVVSWRDHLAQDRGRGRPGFSGYAEPVQAAAAREDEAHFERMCGVSTRSRLRYFAAVLSTRCSNYASDLWS